MPKFRVFVEEVSAMSHVCTHGIYFQKSSSETDILSEGETVRMSFLGGYHHSVFVDTLALSMMEFSTPCCIYLQSSDDPTMRCMRC